MEKRNKYYSSVLSSYFGIIISHPVDTVKTNQQISGEKLYPLLRKLNSQGYKSYYKGIKFPLMFVPLEKGIVFNLDNYLYKKTKNHLYSGFGAGVVAGFFVNFIENYKINQQNLYNMNNINGVFTNGLKHTLLREGVGYTIYFKSYYDYYNKIFPNFIAGGLSGVTAWIVIYPFDRVKTLVQTGNSIKHLNIRNIYQGCGLSLLRAMLMHGTVFYFYENIF